jgi:hypothetical protein
MFLNIGLVSWIDLARPLSRLPREGNKKSSGPAKNMESFQTRSANWGKEETDLLLNASQEIQSNNAKTNLNFTTHELQQVHAFFFCQDQRN